MKVGQYNFILEFLLGQTRTPYLSRGHATKRFSSRQQEICNTLESLETISAAAISHFYTRIRRKTMALNAVKLDPYAYEDAIFSIWFENKE